MELKETFKIKPLFSDNRANEVYKVNPQDHISNLLLKIDVYPTSLVDKDFKLNNSSYLHHIALINKAIISLNSLLNTLPILMDLSKEKNYLPINYDSPPQHSTDAIKDRLARIIQRIRSCDNNIRDLISKANRMTNVIGKNSHVNNSIISYYQSTKNVQRNTLLPNNNIIINKKKEDVLKDNKKRKVGMLVIENDPTTLQIMTSHFKLDFEIHTANNIQSGLQKALDVIPNIIIIDNVISESNDVSLCQTLKSNLLTSHIPIIIISSNAEPISIIEGYGNGADDYISKPFNLDILEIRIWNLLESRHKLKEKYRKEIYLQPQNITITSYDEKFIKKVMSFIEKNISDPSLNVEELSKEIGMSRVTLYRKIKTLTGQTAIGFIRNVRIKRAAQLLEQNNLKINEVAYMVGFLDIDYFRRCFKEQLGHTPSDYVSSRPI